MAHDDFAVQREMLRQLLPLFEKEYIITLSNKLLDPRGFNLEEVPGRSYKIFAPVLPKEKALLARDMGVIHTSYYHMLAIRWIVPDLIGEEYVFIRAYRIGHTLEMETVAMVVEAQVKGGCHFIDNDGHIAGDGKGRKYFVLCPAEAEPELIADLRAEEAKRRGLLPQRHDQSSFRL